MSGCGKYIPVQGLMTIYFVGVESLKASSLVLLDSFLGAAVVRGRGCPIGALGIQISWSAPR